MLDLKREMGMRTALFCVLIACLFFSGGCSLISSEKNLVDRLVEDFKNLTGPPEEEKQEVKKKAEQYLKERYGEEFYVDDLQYIWVSDRWIMRGHLKNEKEWDFKVSEDHGQFDDYYFTVRLSRDAEAEFRPQIEKAFDSLINWETSVSVPDEIEDRYAKSIPSYRELRQKTKRYHQTIRIALATSLTKENQEQELEEVYRLVSYLNQNDIQAELEIFYYDPSIRESGIKKVDFRDRIDYEKFLTAKIEIDDVLQIKKENDLKNHLRFVSK